MWLFKHFTQRKKQKRKLKTEPILPNILEKNVLNFIRSNEGKVIMVLAEIFNTKDNQSIQLSFKEPWTNMERVDKIETLISIEKEIAGMRKELCADLYNMGKGKL